MKYNIKVTPRKDGYINLLTQEMNNHSEISMITTLKYLSEDIEILSSLQNDILVNNKRVYDHFVLFNKTSKSIFAFIIAEPNESNRLRLVIINRPYYTKEIKDPY